MMRTWGKMTQAWGNILAVVVFGMMLPVVLMTQAYIGMTSLSEAITAATQSEGTTEAARAALPLLKDGNDFALYSQMFSERINQSVLLNKQLMKVTVMQIGFAIASMGLMFVILGVKDKGVAAGGEAAGVKFDFKTGSAGVAVFTLGALLAGAAGILKNDYSTVPTPSFAAGSVGPDAERYRLVEQAHDTCREKAGDAASDCFLDLFRQIREQK